MKDNKDLKVVVRTEEKMKSDLEKLAKDNKREFSDYIRLLFEYAIAKKLKF
jgi:hypothetical protein